MYKHSGYQNNQTFSQKNITFKATHSAPQHTHKTLLPGLHIFCHDCKSLSSSILLLAHTVTEGVFLTITSTAIQPPCLLFLIITQLFAAVQQMPKPVRVHLQCCSHPRRFLTSSARLRLPLRPCVITLCLHRCPTFSLCRCPTLCLHCCPAPGSMATMPTSCSLYCSRSSSSGCCCTTIWHHRAHHALVASSIALHHHLLIASTVVAAPPLLLLLLLVLLGSMSMLRMLLLRAMARGLCMRGLDEAPGADQPHLGQDEHSTDDASIVCADGLVG
mmetsp:Transcript_11268/g.30721  ORF Transcript_11268/g.30721 Transcript_11268/m.30721 type:complete len:274 (+) Transcript_11268:767-1588(+)